MSIQRNKDKRLHDETKGIFADPKTAKLAWQSLARAILSKPTTKPRPNYIVDRDGIKTETYDSIVERYSYDSLAKDIVAITGEDRAPTDLEMIIKCQAQHARHNPSSAVFVRDTLGLKPVDESKVDMEITNPYETLSDEELELLAKHRAETDAKQD